MSHEKFIKRTLQLAARGRHKTGLNPMVGALLVKEGTIVAEGFHRGYGLPHAEVEVFENARRRGIADFRGMTLYVNLEPCCHHGKTPPCTDRILREGVSHVVFGTLDPFPAVEGKGLRKLLESKVKTEHGILEDECRRLNRFFFKHVTTGMPFVTLKLAMSLDGQIAARSGDSKWISSEASRKHVHRMRVEHDAVLVGSQTILQDDPLLTARQVHGISPIRVVLDRKLRIPSDARVLNTQNGPRTIIVTSVQNKKSRKLADRGIEIVRPAGTLKSTLRRLYSKSGITGVLIEGGSRIASAVLREKLADEVVFFLAPKLIGNGISAFSDFSVRKIAGAPSLEILEMKKVGGDVMIRAVLR